MRAIWTALNRLPSDYFRDAWMLGRVLQQLVPFKERIAEESISEMCGHASRLGFVSLRLVRGDFWSLRLQFHGDKTEHAVSWRWPLALHVLNGNLSYQNYTVIDNRLGDSDVYSRLDEASGYCYQGRRQIKPIGAVKTLKQGQTYSLDAGKLHSMCSVAGITTTLVLDGIPMYRHNLYHVPSGLTPESEPLTKSQIKVLLAQLGAF